MYVCVCVVIRQQLLGFNIVSLVNILLSPCLSLVTTPLRPSVLLNVHMRLVLCLQAPFFLSLLSLSLSLPLSSSTRSLSPSPAHASPLIPPTFRSEQIALAPSLIPSLNTLSARPSPTLPSPRPPFPFSLFSLPPSPTRGEPIWIEYHTDCFLPTAPWLLSSSPPLHYDLALFQKKK